MAFQSVRGFHDLFGEQLLKFKRVSEVSRTILKRHNFEEIILPVVEYAELFQRSIGEVTDIVQKEMFLFKDRKGRLLALRPEGTAGAVRAFIEHKMYASKPYTKLFYEGPMFRYERPQSGRYRQFHQIGAEMFGVEDASADAEIISIVQEILEGLKIDSVVEINSLGCKECRPAYRESLREFLQGKEEELCKDCKGRKDRNPLRVLDCKEKSCQVAVKDAPKTVDFLCDACREHFEALKAFLSELRIPYRENPNLVRGLDYYTRTVFEAVSDSLGITVIAGGRYDYLVEELGGPPTPALGFAVGMERLSLIVEETLGEEELYVVIPFGEVRAYAMKVADLLRSAGKRVEFSYRRGGLRKQLDFANKLGAKFAVIIGEDEAKEGKVSVKDMETGEQVSLKPEDILQKPKWTPKEK